MSTQALVAETHGSIAHFDADSQMYVTMRIDRQLFGVNVKYVRDVLRHQKVTPVPLAPKEVTGSLNLRGRIVTVIDVRRRLGLPARAQTDDRTMFVVIEIKGELYSLDVDSVGEVLTVSDSEVEKPPAHLDDSWQGVASGIYKLSGELLVIVNVQTLMSF